MIALLFAALIFTSQAENKLNAKEKAMEDFLARTPGYELEDPNVIEVLVEPMDIAKCPRTDDLQINLYDHLCFNSDIPFQIVAAEDDNQFEIVFPIEYKEKAAEHILDLWAKNPEHAECAFRIVQIERIHQELLPEGCLERDPESEEATVDRRFLAEQELPESFSYRDVIHFPPRDQGKYGTCVGQAIASVVDYHYTKCSDEPVQTSAAWIYFLSGDHTCTRGAMPSKLINMAKMHGIALEEQLPHNESCKKKMYWKNIPNRVKDEAKRRKVTGSSNYNAMRDKKQARIKKIKQLLLNKGPAVISFYTKSKYKSDPSCYDYGSGNVGHAVAFTGWTPEGIEYRDSRGPGYCNDGYGIMKWDHLNKMATNMEFIKIECRNDPCTELACGKHGTCSNYAGNKKCTCHSGFTGNQCQIPPNPRPCTEPEYEEVLSKLNGATIFGDGSSEQRPMCGASRCDYDNNMKRDCVAVLCRKAGYTEGGFFIKDTGNACKSSYKKNKGWVYNHSSGGKYHKKTYKQFTASTKETAITAFCSNEPIPPKDKACTDDIITPAEQDCNGVPGGSAEVDECGVCGGDGTSCKTGICDVNGRNIPHCGRCLYDLQCAPGTFCCPEQKKCVDNNAKCGDPCDNVNGSGPSAKCSPGCAETKAGFPYSCKCSNPDFPQNWVPGCPSATSTSSQSTTTTTSSTATSTSASTSSSTATATSSASSSTSTSTTTSSATSTSTTSSAACPVSGNYIPHCGNCVYSDQCAQDSYCCPFTKKCIASKETFCQPPSAGCTGCLESIETYPESCSCSNPRFPYNWVDCGNNVCDVNGRNIPHCGRCLYDLQCAPGTFCCPEQKKCVDNNAKCGDPCDNVNGSGPSAKCSPGCAETKAGFPYSCKCSNPDFPQNWVPGCPSDPCDPNPCKSGESCTYDNLGGPKCIPDETCTQEEEDFCKTTPCSIMCTPSQDCPCSCPSDPPTKAPTVGGRTCEQPDPEYCALANCDHFCPAGLHCPCKCGSGNLDCAGVPNGNAVVDECGVCGGDGTTCTVCDADYSLVEDKKEQFLSECSEQYPADAIDCYEGSIIIKWGGNADKIKETKRMIRETLGIKLKSFPFMPLKPKKECSQMMCKMYCPNGYVKDSNGCDTCKCASPTLVKPISGDALSFECPQKICKVLCQHGYVKDSNGCDTCECASTTLVKPVVGEPCAILDCNSLCNKVGADERGCGGRCECPDHNGDMHTKTEGAKFDADFCSGSPAQTCRMLCPQPTCESEDECAMRTGTCCDFECIHLLAQPCAMVDCNSLCNKVGADERGCGGRCECPDHNGDMHTKTEGAKFDVEFCSGSPAQTCRMLCPQPTCEFEDQCAMRTGTCCDFECLHLPTPATPVEPCFMPNCFASPGVTCKLVGADERGCGGRCDCQAEECAPKQCKMFCPNGFKKDEQGCDTCECAEGSSTDSFGAKMVQRINVIADHPAAKAFALIGFFSVFYSMFKCLKTTSEYDILGRHKSYSSVAEEGEI